MDINEIKLMTRNDYQVRGCTALYDAIGGAIHHIGNIHKYARPEDVPEHTVFVITTDGMENASTKHTKDQVKKLIGQQKKNGWEFLFLAANIDAVEAAESIGIRQERAVNYSVEKDTPAVFDEMSESICAFRCHGTLEDGWGEKFEKRLRTRK